MNCFSGSIILTCLLMCSACWAPASEPARSPASRSYSVHYTISPHADNGSVAVDMQVLQENAQLRELAFDLPGDQLSDIRASGDLKIDANAVVWTPENDGGSLSWVATPSARRRQDGYDALLTDEWGIFRAEDVIPRARTRTIKNATSNTTISFDLPPGWSAVSEYSSIDSRIAVTNDERQFDQPSGWIAVGDLGVRRETIAGTRIAIAAPKGETVRRMDMLALLNWTLPELTAVLPDSLPRLTIVSAGDPMWRGGLSAPASIFIHADRPLISENATSTLVHEVVHVALDIDAADGYDWVVEGLAEYYSLELLQRGAAITARRYQRALETQSDWATEADALCRMRSSGATTALAVTIFRQLDAEIESGTDGSLNLDALITRLNGKHDAVDLRLLQEAASEILDQPSAVLQLENLPGCKNYSSGTA